MPKNTCCIWDRPGTMSSMSMVRNTINCYKIRQQQKDLVDLGRIHGFVYWYFIGAPGGTGGTLYSIVPTRWIHPKPFWIKLGQPRASVCAWVGHSSGQRWFQRRNGWERTVTYTMYQFLYIQMHRTTISCNFLVNYTNINAISYNFTTDSVLDGVSNDLCIWSIIWHLDPETYDFGFLCATYSHVKKVCKMVK